MVNHEVLATPPTRSASHIELSCPPTLRLVNASAGIPSWHLCCFGFAHFMAGWIIVHEFHDYVFEQLRYYTYTNFFDYVL